MASQPAESLPTARASIYQADQTAPPNLTACNVEAQNTRSGQHGSTSHNGSPEVDNVLPSPAPSDEHRQENICIIDLEQEQQLALGGQVSSRKLNDPMNEPEADLLRELTKRYGGIEEIEKRLRSFEGHKSNSTDPSPGPPSDTARFADSARPEKRASDHESDRPWKMVAGNLNDSRINIRSPSNYPPKEPSSQSITSSDATVVGPTKHLLPDATLHHFLHVLQCTKVARDPQSRQGKIAGSRLGLLQDAVKASDSFYMVLHQIYCMYSQSQQTVWESCIGFGIIHSHGLTLLSHLLIDNSALDAEAVKWFSTFPLPMELMLQNHAVFRAAYTKVLGFLRRFQQHWTRIKEESRVRYCPPSANEMTIMLGLDSIVLQGVLYRAIHRDTWTGGYDQCYQDGEKAFFVTQREAHENQRSNQGLLNSQNQAFIHRSQQLWYRHTTYCLASMPPQTIQEAAPVGHMAPPQHRQHTIPPARTSGASGGRPSPSSGGPALNVNASAAQQPRFGPWRVYTPTVLSPPAQNSPVLQADSPMALQGAAPQSFAFQSPSAPSAGSQATANVQFPSTGGPLHNPVAPAMTQQASSGLSSSRHSSTSSLPGHRNPSIPTQSFGGPQSTFPSPMPREQAALLGYSYVIPAAGMNPLPRSSSAAARVPTSAQAPLPQPLHNGSHPAIVHNGYATPHPTPSSGPARLPQSSSVFLRPVDQFPQATTALSAVHQAHLRSPVLEVVNAENKPDPNVKYFTYIKDVVMLPDRLHMHKRHLTWAWDESKEDAESLAAATEAQDGSPSRICVRIGVRLCRLRCVKISSISDVLTESDWAASENTWPGGMAILLNGKGLDVKKKLHQGKDVPINVTSSISEGRNSFSIAISQLPQDDKSVYAFGLENILITSTPIIKSEIKTVDWLEARARILRNSGLADPDVQVLDPTITLDLTDPYSSSLCHTPVRGMVCRHNQCFDLDIFLSTRSSKAPTEPCGPDQFRCPICSADARPKSLIVDGFFLKVREELEQLNRLDAKAIVLEESGKWKVKEVEEIEESDDGTGKRKSMSLGARTGRNPNGSEVIELEDND